LGADLLVEIIPGFVDGKILPQPQPPTGSTYAAKIKKEDGKIDWNLSAEKIWNRLRAFTPWPGAYTFLSSETKLQLLKIWKAEVVEEFSDKNSASPQENFEHGIILSADKNGIVIACEKSALRILELQREGGRRLNAQEFLAGHPLKVGEKFI
jgi:methionyl-tRNA formyltransferase